MPNSSPFAAAPPEIASEPLSPRAGFIGNCSVFLLLMAVVWYWSWRWITQLPASTQLPLFGGLLSPTVGEAGAAFNIVLGFLGGLGATLSTDFPRIVSELFSPLNLIDNSALRRRLCTVPTLLFSGLVCVAAVSASQSVSVLTFASDYEVVAQLAPGSAASFITEEGKEGDRIRIERDKPARLVVSGTSAVLIRDKYGFRTLEAISLDKTWEGFAAAPCAADSLALGQTAASESLAGLIRRRRAIRVVDVLRWSEDRVRTPLVLSDGTTSDKGWIRAGDGLDGPEKGAPEYAQPYLEQLFQNRDLVATWYVNPGYRDGNQQLVHHSIGRYQLEFTYEDRHLACQNFPPFRARDATTVRAVEFSAPTRGMET